MKIYIAQYSSMQLNTAQYSTMQRNVPKMQVNPLNAAECSSTQLNTLHRSASLGETARRAKRAPSASRALLGSSFMHSAGICRDMLGAAAQCWTLLRSVPKLIKFKARFPFFVRQVSKKWLKRLHVCKVSPPKIFHVTC